MDRRRVLGISLVGLGIVLVIVGLFSLLDGDDSPSATTAAATTIAPTTAAPATTAAPTTTAAPITTSVLPTTTTTTPPPTTTTTAGPGPDEVEAFIADFAAAIAAGDTAFLIARLHPVVIALSDEETCRQFVESRFPLVANYRATGPITQTAETFLVDGEAMVVDPMFVVPVAFDFQGEENTTDAFFAAVDREMRWFTQCE